MYICKEIGIGFSWRTNTIKFRLSLARVVRFLIYLITLSFFNFFYLCLYHKIKTMDIIKELRYGNLNMESLPYVSKETFFTKYFDMFANTPYSNLKETKEDIETIIDGQAEYMQRPNWRKYKKFMELADKDIHALFETEMKKIGVEYNGDFLEDIQEELGCLVMMLKQHYNRPRPYQVGYYTKQMIHNFNTISGNTPAYPSGHACQSRFLMKVVAFHNPSKREQLKELADKVAYSRIVLGVHYPRDNQFGFQIADKLASLPEVREMFFKKR